MLTCGLLLKGPVLLAGIVCYFPECLCVLNFLWCACELCFNVVEWLVCCSVDLESMSSNSCFGQGLFLFSPDPVNACFSNKRSTLAVLER